MAEKFHPVANLKMTPAGTDSLADDDNAPQHISHHHCAVLHRNDFGGGEVRGSRTRCSPPHRGQNLHATTALEKLVMQLNTVWRETTLFGAAKEASLHDGLNVEQYSMEDRKRKLMPFLKYNVGSMKTSMRLHKLKWWVHILLGFMFINVITPVWFAVDAAYAPKNLNDLKSAAEVCIGEIDSGKWRTGSGNPCIGLGQTIGTWDVSRVKSMSHCKFAARYFHSLYSCYASISYKGPDPVLLLSPP